MSSSSESSLHSGRRNAVFVLLAAASVGFLFGRLTGVPDTAVRAAVKRSFPALPTPPKPAPKPAADDKNIVLELPADGAAVGSTLEVAGRARVFENNVEIAVRDAKGTAVLKTFVTAETAPAYADPKNAAGQFGRFHAILALPNGLGGEGKVEVYWTSPEDGSQKDLVSRTISFSDPEDLAVNVYFSNNQLDPAVSCTSVYPVVRRISSRAQVYRSAIEELLKGATDEDAGRGYFTSLPAGVTVKSVVQNPDGTVAADFSAKLDKGVAGSCRVSAIRSQIEATLKQFPEVRDVVISIDGRTDGVLQP